MTALYGGRNYASAARFFIGFAVKNILQGVGLAAAEKVFPGGGLPWPKFFCAETLVMRRRGAVCPSFPGGRKSMFFARRMRFSVPFYFDGCKLSVFGQKRPQKARNFCVNCLKHLTKIFGNGRITLATVWAQVFSRAKNLQFEKICGYHTAKTSRKKSPREQKSHFLRAPPICRKRSAFGKRVNLRLCNFLSP